MNRILLIALLATGAFSNAAFADGLDDFLSRVNVQARVDLDDFSIKVGAQFGVPAAQVKVVLRTTSEPADAFMVFQLGEMTGLAPEKVLSVYQKQKGKGWGVIAKELGIKPGSAEFHALKNGDLHFGPKSGAGSAGDKGKGKGKNKPGK